MPRSFPVFEFQPESDGPVVSDRAYDPAAPPARPRFVPHVFDYHPERVDDYVTARDQADASVAPVDFFDQNRRIPAPSSKKPAPTQPTTDLSPMRPEEYQAMVDRYQATRPEPGGGPEMVSALSGPDISTPEDGRTWGEAVTDTGKAVMAGVYQGVGDAIGYGIEAAGEKIGSAGMADYGREMREIQQAEGEKWLAKLSPEGRAMLEKQLFDGWQPNLDDDFLGAVVMKSARSMPGMVAMAPVGGVLTKGIGMVGKAALPEVAGALVSGSASPMGRSLLAAAKQKGIYRALADRALSFVPSAVGYGAAEGGLAGLQNAAQLRTDIEGMDPKALYTKSPTFRDYVDAADGDVETAQKELAKDAAGDVALKTMISTGTIGALTGGGALGMVSRQGKQQAGAGVVKSFFKGGAEEAIQETPQSGAETYIENTARRDYLDPDIDPMEGVLEASLEGTIVGGFSGGLFGGGGAVAQPGRRNKSSNQPITQPGAAGKDAARPGGGGGSAAEDIRAEARARKEAQSSKLKAESQGADQPVGVAGTQAKDIITNDELRMTNEGPGPAGGGFAAILPEINNPNLRRMHQVSWNKISQDPEDAGALNQAQAIEAEMVRRGMMAQPSITNDELRMTNEEQPPDMRNYGPVPDGHVDGTAGDVPGPALPPEPEGPVPPGLPPAPPAAPIAMPDETSGPVIPMEAESSKLEAQSEVAERAPWQMTHEEFVAGLPEDTRFYPPQPGREGARMVRLDDGRVVTTGEHGAAVFEALKAGQPVSPEVLKDYPEFTEIANLPAPGEKTAPSAAENETISGEAIPEHGGKSGQIPSILDQFETEQQERLDQRKAGDRRVSIVNHHPVTGMMEGKYANQRLAEIGAETAQAHHIPVVYVEGDLYNLNGLNGRFGQSGADPHFAAMAAIAQEEFDRLGVEIGYTTKGGDEFGFTVVGATQDQVDAVIDNITPRVDQYVRENGLADLPHTKTGRNPGTGLTFAARQFDPATHKNAEEWIADADEALEIKKKTGGFSNEYGQSTETAGAVPLEGQPGSLDAGTGAAPAGAPEQSVTEAPGPAADQPTSESEVSPQETAPIDPAGTVAGSPVKEPPRQTKQEMTQAVNDFFAADKLPAYKKALETGKMPNGKPVTEEYRQLLQEEIARIEAIAEPGPASEAVSPEAESGMSGLESRPTATAGAVAGSTSEAENERAGIEKSIQQTGEAMARARDRGDEAAARIFEKELNGLREKLSQLPEQKPPAFDQKLAESQAESAKAEDRLARIKKKDKEWQPHFQEFSDDDGSYTGKVRNNVFDWLTGKTETPPARAYGRKNTSRPIPGKSFEKSGVTPAMKTEARKKAKAFQRPVALVVANNEKGVPVGGGFVELPDGFRGREKEAASLDHTLLENMFDTYSGDMAVGYIAYPPEQVSADQPGAETVTASVPKEPGAGAAQAEDFDADVPDEAPDFVKNLPMVGDVPYFVENKTPAVPSGKKVITSEIVHRKTKDQPTYRFSVVENADGTRYSMAEKAEDVHGTPSRVDTRFVEVDNDTIDNDRWLNSQSKKIWEQYPAEETPGTVAGPTSEAIPGKPGEAVEVEAQPDGDAVVSVEMPEKKAKALSPKAQKKYFIAEIAAALKSAPEFDGFSPSKNATKDEKLAELKAEYGEVTIEIPGDGEYSVINTKKHIQELEKRAKKFPVMPGLPKKSAPTGKPANRLSGFEGEYYNTYARRTRRPVLEHPTEKPIYEHGFYSDHRYLVKTPKPKVKKPLDTGRADMMKTLVEDHQKADIPAKIAGELVHNHAKAEPRVDIVDPDGNHYLYRDTFIDNILTLHPTAKPFFVDDGNNPGNRPVVFKVKDEVVGLAMPVAGEPLSDYHLDRYQALSDPAAKAAKMEAARAAAEKLEEIKKKKAEGGEAESSKVKLKARKLKARKLKARKRKARKLKAQRGKLKARKRKAERRP